MNNTIDYKFHTFPSGLRLVMAPMRGTKTATVLVMVGTGSKYETKDINGVSHFLEHMMFKGTTKRPGKMDIARELDGLGAEYNAFTGKEYTGYYARAASSKFDVIADVVFDIFLNSKLDGKEIEMEKGVIIEEINMYHDNPQRHVWDILQKLLYGEQPAGWDIAGEKETVNALNREKIKSYFDTHYIASNTVIAIAGDIDPDAAKEKVSRYFSGIRQAQKVSKLPVKIEQSAPATVIQFKESDQSHFVITFRAHNMFDDRKYAEDVLAAILGGWMSSRLFMEVRDKRGLAYYIGAEAGHETDTGEFSIFAGVNNDKAQEAIKVIMSEAAKILKNGVTKEELQKAKDYAEGRLVMALENSRAVAQAYVDPVLFENKVLTPEQELAKIKAVTLDDIKQAAIEIFDNSKLNLALIGPFKEAEPFTKILKL